MILYDVTYLLPSSIYRTWIYSLQCYKLVSFGFLGKLFVIYDLRSAYFINVRNIRRVHGLRTPRKIPNFWAGADKLGWNISGQTISTTILALWVPCPWENVSGYFSCKKLWFLGLKHTTAPKIRYPSSMDGFMDNVHVMRAFFQKYPKLLADLGKWTK